MKQPEISWSIQGGAVVKELTVSTLKRRVVFSAPNMRGLLDKVRGLPFAAPVSYDDFRRRRRTGETRDSRCCRGIL